jgi:glutamate 5-kinase
LSSLSNASGKLTRQLAGVHRLVVKVGTSTITHATGKLDLGQMEKLVREISDVANSGKDVLLVTSGAIGAGMSRLGLDKRPATLPGKQAMAAVGQGLLMQIYEKLFSEYGQTVAQVLLTREDLNDRRRFLNSRNTLLTLLDYGVIPIINENDTVAVEEIRVGDNDTLSALVSGLVGADLLIILSDVDGVFTADPRIDPEARVLTEIRDITPKLWDAAGGAGSSRGTGGMVTKLEAARITTASGGAMVIANGREQGVIGRILSGEPLGTLFHQQDHALQGRKRWIAFYQRPRGRVIIDQGAQQALVNMGKSLLPVGVVDVEGDFAPGDVVRVVDEKGLELARGLVNYSSSELVKIKGLSTQKVEELLGYRDYDEVIHRDNLALCEGGRADD